MNLFENYNNTKQKYGEFLVANLTRVGVPPKYLLAACRFHQECGVPVERVKQLFKQWMTYVVKNGSSIDVNRLTFEQFYQTIQKFKSDYGIPNKVYNDGIVSIGKVTSAKDMSRFPVTNDWCIKQPSMFQKYKDAGYTFYIIDNRDESDYVRYVILMVGKDGRKYYYDLDNEQMTQDSVLDYQSHLTPQSISFIQSLTENKQHNTNMNMNKNKIRLTESQLHNMIIESVKRVLSETRFGKPQPVFGNAINGKSAYLINDTGRMVAVIDNLKFVGNSIIGGNRATDEKVTFYLTGLFGHPVDGSTLPGTRKTKDGLYITHLQMDGGDEYYELLIDDYLLTPESAAEWDYYDPRNRRDIDDDDINRFY